MCVEFFLVSFFFPLKFVLVIVSNIVQITFPIVLLQLAVRLSKNVPKSVYKLHNSGENSGSWLYFESIVGVQYNYVLVYYKY